MEGELTKTSVIIGLVALSIALLGCAAAAHRSKKSISFDVELLALALIVPMMGNLVIVVSGDRFMSEIGGYLCSIGMNLVAAALLRFSAAYCGVRYRDTIARRIVLVLIALDIVQMLFNSLAGHVFTLSEVSFEGSVYYALVPLAGHIEHRILIGGIALASIGIIVYKVATSPNVYLERYLVVLIAVLISSAWEAYFVFHGLPVDLSLLGFGAFGLLTCTFALHYQPVLLLNGILARVVGDMRDAVFFFDRDHRCIYANPTGMQLFQFKANGEIEDTPRLIADIIGIDELEMNAGWSSRCQVLIGEDGIPHPVSDATKAESSESSGVYLSDAGKHYWQIVFHTMDDERGRQVGTYLTVHDRTSEETRLRRERRAAEHDQLTDLYNSTHLYAMAQRAMRANPAEPYCVVGIDVREFKLINDVYSKEFGDQVLRAIADRIRSCATPHEVYGRITADRFGLALPARELDTSELERRLSLEDISVGDITYPVIIHLGVYDVVEDDLPVDVMFDRAFMAIAPIKRDYSRRVARYDNTMRETALWNRRITAELDDALATGQIRPYLQPLMNERGEVQGAEVLVRWIHPELGFLPPDRFIPCFEENGRVAQIDLFMWESACKIISHWQSQGLDLFLSVNISPKDFYFMDVPETINNLVRKHGVNPKNLRLEITETVVMSDAENRLRIIEDLRASGFLVEMDDFGSGYSSLNMLKDMPVDLLKIDMIFLRKSSDAQRSRTILQTIVDLSLQLGIPSITEGVETAEQLSMLTAMGCRLFQGYYFDKPLPVEEFQEKYCRPLIGGEKACNRSGMASAPEPPEPRKALFEPRAIR